MRDGSLVAFYGDWPRYNARLVGAIRPLTAGQLALRAAPGKWPIWAIAAHTAGARVYWLCGVFKESGAESTPFTDIVNGVGWEDDEDTPRDADELVGALASSWKILETCLERWTLSMLNDEYPRDIGGKRQKHTRRSVLNRLITHDAFHAGEISLILGAHGLPEIDIWRPVA